MTIYLKQNTASQEVQLPRFVDSTDGNTEKTGLTIANTDIKIWKNGATTLASKNSGGATHIANGIYYCVLDATDTDTLGPLMINVHVSGALSVQLVCCVLAANIFDSLIGGGDLLDTSVVQWTGTNVASPDTAGYPKTTLKTGTGAGEVNLSSGTVTLTDASLTAAKIADDAITAAKIANGAIDAATFAAGAIDAAAIATDAIGSAEISAAAVTKIQSGLSVLDAAAVRTAIGLATANLDTQLAAIAGYIDTEIASIISSIAALNNLSAAQVKTQVVAALNTDTYAEPSSVPAATATLVAKIGFLMALARNKITQTGTTQTLYADDGSTTVATAAVSDDGTTATRSEFA